MLDGVVGVARVARVGAVGDVMVGCGLESSLELIVGGLDMLVVMALGVAAAARAMAFRRCCFWFLQMSCKGPSERSFES